MRNACATDFVVDAVFLDRPPAGLRQRAVSRWEVLQVDFGWERSPFGSYHPVGTMARAKALESVAREKRVRSNLPMREEEMTQEERYKNFEDDIDGSFIGEFMPEYHGRSFYNGPAVRIDQSELQDIIRLTTVQLQWDQLGKSGLIVYPK